jgi:hypothetical protein
VEGCSTLSLDEEKVVVALKSVMKSLPAVQRIKLEGNGIQRHAALSREVAALSASLALFTARVTL